jgi:hypothetical protein
MTDNLTKLIKEIEKEKNCACDIDVNTVKNGKHTSQKYGSLEERKIKLNKITGKYGKDAAKDIKLLRESYISVEELKDYMKKNNLLSKYHVLKDGIYLRTPGIHVGFAEGVGYKIASIEYERLR